MSGFQEMSSGDPEPLEGEPREFVPKAPLPKYAPPASALGDPRGALVTAPLLAPPPVRAQAVMDSVPVSAEDDGRGHGSGYGYQQGTSPGRAELLDAKLQAQFRARRAVASASHSQGPDGFNDCANCLCLLCCCVCVKLCEAVLEQSSGSPAHRR